MMDGVTVLSEKLVDVTQFNLGVAFVTFILTVFICFIIGLAMSCVEGDECYLFLITFMGAIVGLMFGFLIGSENETKIGSYTEYKVTVSDDTLMKEFNSTYEVLDIEGNIYTVKYRGDCE